MEIFDFEFRSKQPKASQIILYGLPTCSDCNKASKPIKRDWKLRAHLRLPLPALRAFGPETALDSF